MNPLEKIKFDIIETEPAWPFSYRCWHVRAGKNYWTVVEHEKNKNFSCTCDGYKNQYKIWGDGTLNSWGNSRFKCAHIIAVEKKLWEQKAAAEATERRANQKTTMPQHARKVIGMINGHSNPYGTPVQKANFWVGVKRYANMNGLSPTELEGEIRTLVDVEVRERAKKEIMRGWDGNTVDLPTTGANIRVPRHTR